MKEVDTVKHEILEPIIKPVHLRYQCVHQGSIGGKNYFDLFWKVEVSYRD